MLKLRIIVPLTALMAVRLAHADDTPPTEDLKRYWRSDHYGELSNGVLSRPAIAIDTPQCRNNEGPQS
jgi:hypothetical protein